MKPAAAERGWSNRPLVREADTQRARSLWRVLGCLAIALSPVVVCVVQQNECLRILFALNALRVEHEALRNEEQLLRVERARLESFARIEAWATRERGLARPDPRRVLVLPLDATEPRDLLAGGPVAVDSTAPNQPRLAGWVGHGVD